MRRFRLYPHPDSVVNNATTAMLLVAMRFIPRSSENDRLAGIHTSET